MFVFGHLAEPHYKQTASPRFCGGKEGFRRGCLVKSGHGAECDQQPERQSENERQGKQFQSGKEPQRQFADNFDKHSELRTDQPLYAMGANTV